MQQVGFIRLARMGKPMASNLCKKGFELLVYDVDPQALAAFGRLNAKPAQSIADGLLAHAQTGQVILDMSTIDPATMDLLTLSPISRR
jgi:4-hydroxybutyrate dehydrogenase / sulfolactaldehyde 3-reductase